MSIWSLHMSSPDEPIMTFWIVSTWQLPIENLWGYFNDRWGPGWQVRDREFWLEFCRVYSIGKEIQKRCFFRDSDSKSQIRRFTRHRMRLEYCENAFLIVKETL